MIVACSQYQSRNIFSIQEFENHVKDHLEQACRKGAKLILFPEFLAVELLTLAPTPYPKQPAMEAMFRDYAVRYTDYLAKLFTGAAKKYQMAIAAGTHFVYNADEDKYRNTAFVYLPNGTVFRQNKIHRAIVLVNICWLGTLAYKYMVALGKAVVPVVVFLACYFVIRLILPAGGVAFHSAPTAAAPFITAFGTAFGTFVVSGTMTGDIVRYCKGTKDSIIVTIFAFFVGNSGSLILGALASAAVPGIDQYFGMTAFLGGIPLIICAGISQWSTASSCLYNAVSGYTNIFRKLGWTKAVIIGGVGGSLVAVSGFISDLAAYMSFLGILVPPVGGVIIADYYLVRKGLKYGDKNLSGVNWWAIASLVTAVVLSYISSKVFPAVPHQAVGIIVSAVMYAIVGRQVSYDKVS